MSLNTTVSFKSRVESLVVDVQHYAVPITAARRASNNAVTSQRGAECRLITHYISCTCRGVI